MYAAADRIDVMNSMQQESGIRIKTPKRTCYHLRGCYLHITRHVAMGHHGIHIESLIYGIHCHALLACSPTAVQYC